MANKLAPQKMQSVPQRSSLQRMTGQKSTPPQKPGQRAATPVKNENRIVKFAREVRSEMKKVTWPTREAAINLTILVVAVSAAVGIVLGVIDFAFEKLFESIIGIV